MMQATLMNCAPAANDDRSDATLLTARQVVAAALAAALAEPATPMGQRRHDTVCDVLSYAWRCTAETFDQMMRGCRPEGSPQAELAIGETPPREADIQPLIRWLATDPATRLLAHQAVFGLVISKQCPAYETEYSHTRDATYRAHQMADIAGFYQAFGLGVAADSAERCDQVALELEFVAFLLAKSLYAADDTGEQGDEHRAVCRSALHGFVRHHVAWWMPTFGRCLERRAEQVLAAGVGSELADAVRALAGVGRLLRAWVCIERTLVGVEANRQIVAPQVETESDELACATCALSGALTAAAPQSEAPPP